MILLLYPKKILNFETKILAVRMRIFNTSGPNIAEEHYTIERTNLIGKGVELVASKRYFTIWAPRQTGKSTYFRQLAKKLLELGYFRRNELEVLRY